ncbi:MAG: DNA-3-methyladenine glycosylase [Bacteroidales bacterium]|nr:DNA-3-methyladenine glycosylase [Bacteroidales bacterium]
MATERRQNSLLSNALPLDFFQDDVLRVAPLLLGKYLVRKLSNGAIKRSKIIEVEAYRGEEDLACHASKGKTKRTEVMYWQGGHIYVYFIYGMYYMLNIVTGKEHCPQAILIRSTEEVKGPGRLTKFYEIDKTFNGKVLSPENGLWIENNLEKVEYYTTPRIGVEYAKEWKLKPWRYVAKNYW